MSMGSWSLVTNFLNIAIISVRNESGESHISGGGGGGGGGRWMGGG